MADTLRVLYVDDESDLLDITRMFLEESGNFSVTTIDSAPAALDLLDKEQFDAIVSDYQMPGMNGIEFLTWVRKKFGSLPFILFTGKGREEVVIEAINRGADFYLQKGGEPGAQYAELSHKIRSATSREKTEATLRENERKYRNLYQYAQVGLFETRLRDGTVIACNERYATLAGFASANDAIGKDIAPLYVNPDDRDTVIRILREQGHIDDHIVMFQNHQTGSHFWAQFSARLHLEKDAAEGTIIDITEQKQVEENLRESEERYKAIVETSPDMIWEIDPGGTFRYISPQIRNIMGYDQEMLVGRGVTEIIPEAARPYVMAEIARHVSIKMPFLTVEVPALHKDGRDMVIEIRSSPVFGRNGNLVGLRGIAHDITERRRASELAQESENKFASVFNGSPVALTLVSASDGIFVDINDAFLRATGYARDEVIGVTSEALGIFANEKERDRLASSLRDRTIVEDMEISCRIKTGEIRACLFSSCLILIGGRPHILSTVRDITARKQVEMALRESEAKFRLITENSPDHIFIQDKDLHYTWVINPQLGLKTEDMLGKTDYDFLSKGDADKLTSIKRQVLETGMTIPYDTSLVSSQGDHEYFEGAYLPKYDGDGRIDGLVGYFRNITQRKREEEWISEVNTAFLKFRPDPLENINILTGLAGKMLQGTCSLYNRLEGGMLCSLGMWNTPPDFAPCDLPEGHICYDIIQSGGKSPTIITNLLESPYAGTDPNVRRYQLQTYIGIPVDIGEKSLGSLCVVYQHVYSPSRQDLEILSFLAKAIAIEDERRTAGQELRESEAKHRILIEESSDPLFTFTSEGRYTYANQALANAFGKPAGEIIGKKIWDFFPKEEADKRFAALSQVFRTGEKNVVEGPVPVAGGDRYYLTTITPVKDTAGKVTSAICTAIDITGRKQTEEALEQSERSYRGLFNSVRQAIYILDDEGRFIDVNEGAERMYGYAREEFIGKTPEFISAPGKNDFVAVMKQISNAFAGEPQQFEFWGIRNNREIFPKEVRLYKGTYFGRNVIIATGTDITGRRNTEVEFQAMVTSMVGTTGMTSLRKIAGNISSWLGAECVMVGEVQPDLQTVKVLAMLLDGKEAPDYTYTLKGTPCDDVAEKEFCLYPDNVISLFPESRDLVNLNIKGYLGTPLHGSDGHVIGILCALFRHPVPTIPGMQETMNIIAVKAAAEIEGMQSIAALQESEEKFRAIFENANDAITVLGFTPDGLPSRFTIVNENACRITGYTREEMLSLSPKDLDSEEWNEAAMDFTQKIMERGYLVSERTLVRKDGKKIPIEISTHVFSLNHQNMMLSIFRDITERRATDGALRLANQKLNLLSGITRHDINNQLTILMGYLSILEKTPHDPMLDTYFGKVRTAAGRISALVRFTKDYEQLGLNTPVWQEIGKISKMAAVDLLPGSVSLTVNTGSYEVFADPMFMLVLYNLFENSNRHGVHVTEITLNFIEEENRGTLIIEDNGIGVPPALKEKIFEKGFGSNTGFGLYLSREILPITGLSILETGIEGKGARFEINLPPGTWRRGPG